MKKIDLNTWHRKVQYDFFKDFEDPFFSATSNIDCTNAYLEIKKSGNSFFTLYMHRALKALNEIPEFRTRISDNDIVLFEKINGTTTVFKEDHTFSFSYFEYHEEFERFEKEAKESIEQAKKSNDLISNPELNLVYVSVIPWRTFTSLKHPRSGNKPDSVPRIVFGKVFQQEGIYLMPVSVDAHHSLVDGYHASLFFNRFEELMQEI